MLLAALACGLAVTVAGAQEAAQAAPAHEPAAGPVVAAPTRAEAQAELAAGHYVPAAELFEQLVAQSPQDGDLWFLLGYAWHSAGRLDKAIPAHRKAAGFPTHHADGNYNLACALALSGDADGAFEALGAALDAGFANRGMLASDADLAPLRADARWAPLVERISGHARGEEAAALDFWLGEWEVRDAQGQLLGHNLIEHRVADQVIHERWSGARGGHGESWNWFDRAEKLHHQVWVDEQGGVIAMQGRFHDGAMRLLGETHAPDGHVELHRTTLTPLPDGRVRQDIEQSRDGGQTWYTWFDGYYSRAAPTPATDATSAGPSAR